MSRSHSSVDSSAPSEIGRRIEGILQNQMGLEVPDRETDLLASGTLDSLALVDLIVRLEKVFERPIPLSEIDLDELRTIDGIARLVAARRNGG